MNKRQLSESAKMLSSDTVNEKNHSAHSRAVHIFFASESLISNKIADRNATKQYCSVLLLKPIETFSILVWTCVFDFSFDSLTEANYLTWTQSCKKLFRRSNPKTKHGYYHE